MRRSLGTNRGRFAPYYTRPAPLVVVHRRRLLSLAALTTIAGCSTGRDADDGGSGTAVPVTTTTADDLVFLVSQLAVRDDAPGPLAYFRLRNDAETDATVQVETVLSITDGGTYTAFAYATVPAGDEVTVSYPVVDYDDLTAAERRRLEQGDGVDFAVLVNGRERQDV